MDNHRNRLHAVVAVAGAVVAVLTDVPGNVQLVAATLSLEVISYLGN